MTKSKSKQSEEQPNNHDQPESPAEPKVPTKASEWPLPKGFRVVEGESHIFIGGFPCPPPKNPQKPREK